MIFTGYIANEDLYDHKKHHVNDKVVYNVGIQQEPVYAK